MRAWSALGLGLVVGCGPIADEREYRIEGDFTSVRVELSNGDLVVEEVGGAQVLVDADFGGVGAPGTVSRFLDGDQLVIDYACGLCGGDLEVGVPTGMPVDVLLQHGDLELDGLTGPVTAELHAGSVTGEDLACDTTIFNHAGSIELEWDFRPVFVDAEAHLGAIALEVPAGGYRLETSANMGVVRLIDVFHDEDADSELRAFTHAGEVEVAGQ